MEYGEKVMDLQFEFDSVAMSVSLVMECPSAHLLRASVSSDYCE